MTETIPYEVAGTVGEAELRRYPPLVLATVQDDENDSGFRHLFAFITGSNRARSSIPMTAPVITSEKIPMTAPVISGAGAMSFVMPPSMPADQVPEPTDEVSGSRRFRHGRSRSSGSADTRTGTRSTRSRRTFWASSRRLASGPGDPRS